MYYINCIYIMYIVVVFCINDGCSAAKYRRVFGPLGGRNTYPDRHCLILASHTYSTIWTNTFDNLDKYFSQFWQIHFKIWTNTFQNLDKYISQFGQIYITIWTNTFHNLDKFISKFAQIHFTIWTNIFCNLDKYFLHSRPRPAHTMVPYHNDVITI